MHSLEHDERPWGCYDVLLDTDFTKVKLITVAPGKRLSYQSHEHRQEQWVVGDYFGEDDIVRYQDDWDRGIHDHLDDWVDRKEKSNITKTDWWNKMSKNG